MEEWKDVPNYERLYQASNLGNIRSLNYNHTGKIQILKMSIDKDGYPMITLHKNGKQKTYRVHRIVAQTFLENPNNYPEVNHKDENKQNNKVENLEWCTCKYNQNYGTRTERSAKGKGKKVVCINTGEIFDTIKEAERKYNLKGESGISYVCKGKRISAGKHPVTGEKLKWRYLDEI